MHLAANVVEIHPLASLVVDPLHAHGGLVCGTMRGSVITINNVMGV